MTLTPDQHRTHGPRLQAAAVAVDGVTHDLFTAKADARTLRAAARAAEALAALRSELEDLALRDTHECTYEIGPGDRQDYYYPATQNWLDCQSTCPTCGAPKENR